MRRCPSFDTLSLAASTGPSPELREHLERCGACARSWERLLTLAEAARSLPRARPARADGQVLERRILGLAAQQPRRPAAGRRERTGRGQRWAGWGALAAAAAALLLWFTAAPPPAALERRGVIAAGPGAAYQHLTRHPGERGEGAMELVQLDQGLVELEVEHLAEGERFVVATDDAEVEVRGTAFSVEAAGGRLQRVSVREGRVEVRFGDEAPRLLLPGESWVRGTKQPRPAGERAAVSSAPTQPPGAPGPAPEQPEAEGAQVAALGPLDPRGAERAREPVRREAAPPVAQRRQADAAPAAERAFADAWDALRAGDAPAAARLFGSVAALAGGEPLAVDAAYWQIVALARAEDADAAIPAMERFLAEHPRSRRAGRVHLMLGLRLLAAGDRPGAAHHLGIAADDPLPRVRTRASEALERL